MDLLVPGVGEIIGGSQREERYDLLAKRIEELGMDIEDYKWYRTCVNTEGRSMPGSVSASSGRSCT